MESTVRISIGSISLLVQYKAILIFIYCQSSWKHTYQSSWKRLGIGSLQQKLSYQEVLYDEATEGWCAPRDPDELDREEHNYMCLARQFCHIMKEYRERFFTYVLFQSPTRSVAAHLESYLLHIYYTSHFGNLCDDIEIYQLELDWIT